jgi:hypothetical protein
MFAAMTPRFFLTSPLKRAGVLVWLAAHLGFAETVVFSHEGSVYHSITDGKEPGLFVYEKSKQRETSLFLAPKRLGDAVQGLMVAISDGKMRFVSPGCEHTLDAEKGFVQKRKIQLPVSPPAPCLWTLADYNGDGHSDVVVFSLVATDAKARIFYGRADGSFAMPFVLQAGGKDFDSAGIRSPHFVNLDEDDDLDFLHLDAKGRLIYYENSNTNSEPLYSAGRILATGDLQDDIFMRIAAMTPFDANHDGDMDLLTVTQNGTIVCLIQSGQYTDGYPTFLPLKPWIEIIPQKPTTRRMLMPEHPAH